MVEVDPPAVDTLFEAIDELPECKTPRSYEDLVVEFMDLFGLSKPEAERELEKYRPGQAEYLIRNQWEFEVSGTE